MLKIDSHQHFWVYDALRDSWISEEMAVFRRDFMPDHLLTELQQHHFDGSVVVQSDQSPAENLFQIQNAAAYPFIKGIVGWVDLQAADLEDQLEELSKYEKLKGFRHILQGEADRALMLKPAFTAGIALLKRFGFTYDILIFPDQLKYAAELVARFPEQAFVVDHLAKPPIKSGEIDAWAADIKALAAYPNVHCKVSGMVTEADLAHWKPEDLRPYLDIVFEAFGVMRLMYGSDWPVCLLAASYSQVLQVMEAYMEPFSAADQALFWGGNATRFYNLNKNRQWICN